jgi:hypothetical protein
MSTTINEVLDAMWEAVEQETICPFDGKSILNKRMARSRWRKILAQHKFDQTRTILHVGNGHFLFSSDSHPGEFHSIDMDEFTCTCDGHVLGGKTCHHLKDMAALENKGLLPKNTKWKGEQ